jgi:putative membrane protein
MIRGYSDHAANERTFLAWVRTGIAVIAFGFVVEKFNLLCSRWQAQASPDAGHRLQLERLSGPLGRYDGLMLILIGMALIIVAAGRFMRTGRLIDDQEVHSASSVRADSADDERSCRRIVNGTAAVDTGVLVFTSGVHDASSVPSDIPVVHSPQPADGARPPSQPRQAAGRAQRAAVDPRGYRGE